MSLGRLQIVIPHIVKHLARVPLSIPLEHAVNAPAVIGVYIFDLARAGPVMPSDFYLGKLVKEGYFNTL